MPLPIAPLLHAVPVPVQPPLDGATTAFLTALAPLWPALEPWLIVGSVVLAMGVATEVVVRELQRLPRRPLPARARPGASR
jgi:hypothetical protein